nr:immunoglobulin heavy chain junction region [Macaca mulatta]
CVRVNTEFDSW